MIRISSRLAQIHGVLFDLLPLSLLLPRGVSQLILLALLIFEVRDWIAHPSSLLPQRKVAFIFGVFLLFIFFFFLRFDGAEIVHFYDFGIFWIPLGLWIGLRAGKNTARLVRSFLIAGYLYGLIGFLQFFGLLPTSQSSISSFIQGAALFRSTGLQPHASAFALIGLLLLPWLGSQVISATPGRARTRTVLSFLFVSVGVSSTLGRMAILCATLVCLIFSGVALRAHVLKNKKVRYRQLIGALCIFLILTFIALPILLNSTNPTISRLRETAQMKGAQGERFAENILGIAVLKKYPLGVGLGQISKVASHLREELPELRSFDDEFKSWRGIHNGYLNFGAVWGIPGLLLYIGLLLLPVILSLIVFGKVTLFAGLLCTELVLFSASDTVIYFETTLLMGLLSGLGAQIPIARPSRHSQAQARGPSMTVMFLVIPICMTVLSSLRQTWIHSIGAVVSIVFDNPTQKPWEITLGNARVITLPPGSVRVLTRRPGEYTLAATDGEVRESQSLTLFPRTTHLSHEQYLWTTDNRQRYWIKHFMVQGERVIKVEKPFSVPHARQLIALPPEVLSSGAMFGEEDPVNYSQRIARRITPDGELSAPSFPADVLTRSGYSENRNYSCWEPSWVTFFGRWDTNLCSINAQWNSYGSRVYINYAKYFWSLLLGR